MSCLYDAHCHPTEVPASLDRIPQMRMSRLIAMSTTLADIELVHDIATKYPQKVVAAYGYHPWFSHLVYIGEPKSKMDHYSSVLTPQPTQEFVEKLPEPVPFDSHLAKMRTYLTEHQHAIVGELGLDKAFRLPIPQTAEKRVLSPYRVSMAHQVLVLERQLALAAELGRAVSLHGVQCHSALQSSVTKLLSKSTQCNICLHSYSGSPEFLATSWLKLKNKVFVSASVLINATSEERARKLLAAVPANCILTESDYHSGGDEMDGFVVDSLELICRCYGWDLEEGASQIERNFMAFTGVDI